MPELSALGQQQVGKCWNGIYQTLSRTQSRYQELKAKNPNITIIVEEVGPRLKERFLELIELVLLENRDLNRPAGRKQSAVEWQYGPCTEYFLKNDLLGTIVSFASGSDMPRDLIDEVAYLIASFAHDMPPSFLCNESILLPTSRFLDTLIGRPSKYSVVLCEKIVMRVEEYQPLWKLFAANNDNSLARLIIFLANLPEAFSPVLRMVSGLLKIEVLSIEAEMLQSIIEIIMERLGSEFDVVTKAFWTEESITSFMNILEITDNFIQAGLSDEGKLQLAQSIKEKFIQTHLKPSLRQLKLYDGSVLTSLNVLSAIFSRIQSVELCLPIGQCFKNYFFTELVDDTDCLNLMRLMFVEGETQISLALVNLLRAVIENESRQLLPIFQLVQRGKIPTKILSASDHEGMCGLVMSLFERLPEEIIDKNIENMSLLYRSHLIMAEKEVPESEALLNIVDQEPSVFSTLIVKTLDAFSLSFWSRQPSENLQICRLLLTLLSKTDMGFCYDKLLGDDPVYSLLEIGKSLSERLASDSLREHVHRAETLRSIARFRASLFEQVHKGSLEQDDMFAPGGLLDSLFDGIERKTVGSLSGNVLLFSSFYMRCLSIIQTQSTRPFKTIAYSKSQ